MGYRIGVYVDISNIAQGGGYGLHYDILREFAIRNGGQIIHLNAYIAFDKSRANRDLEYQENSERFHSKLRSLGFKVIIKEVKRYQDEKGNFHLKSNIDLDMAVDILLAIEKIDYLLILTGDGDFVPVVKAAQNKGIRVEVLAFKNISTKLKKEADFFISGYLVPGLLSTKEKNIVRGTCYSYQKKDGFGFMRFSRKIQGNLWIKDSRRNDSPYESAFFHINDLNNDIDNLDLPNENKIFEFTINKNRNDNTKGWVATKIHEVETK